MTRSRRVAGRAGWGIADQILSSSINFGLGIAVARAGTTEEFGAYGLVFGAYLIAINITRPIAIEPLIIRWTGAPAATWRPALAAATGIVVITGIALGLLAALAGWAVGGVSGAAFLVVGIGLPGLVLQDAWRLSFFAEGHGRKAFVNDLAWAVVFGGLLALWAWSGTLEPTWILGAWVGGAAVAAVLGMVQAGRGARPRPSRSWWRDHRDLSLPLLGEHAATNILNELVPYAVGAIAGLAAVGALRGAQLLLGPFNVIFQALGLVALPEAVRIAGRSIRQLRLAAIGFSAALAILVIIAGLLASALPTTVGVAILGDAWEATSAVLLPYTLVVAAGMSLTGATIGLRALAEAREILATGIARSVLTLGGAILGASLGGAVGAALWMAGGGWIGSAIVWWRFRGAIRRAARKASAETPADAPAEAPAES